MTSHTTNQPYKQPGLQAVGLMTWYPGLVPWAGYLLANHANLLANHASHTCAYTYTFWAQRVELGFILAAVRGFESKPDTANRR